MSDQTNFVKIDEAAPGFGKRAILKLIPNENDPRNPLVTLRLPMAMGWSALMPVNDAMGLIARDQKFIPDPSVVEVIDPDELWPLHWTTLL